MKYFVYRYIRLDLNEPFYIGVGTKPKQYASYIGEYKRALEKHNRNKYWLHLVNLNNYEVEIIFETNDYNTALEKEIEFIKLYGRKDLGTGTLVNNTNGGEGRNGAKLSKEHIAILIKCHNKRKGIPLKKDDPRLLIRLKPVLQYDLDGNFIKRYNSIKEAREETGLPSTQIYKKLNNKPTKTKNFIWKYENKGGINC